MNIVTHNHQAFAVWITGLPASGKSTVAVELTQQIRALGVKITILESDALRKVFSTNPGYDDRDREYFYGSLAFIGRLLTEHGISVIFDATANRRSYRNRARQQIPRFIEVFVDCPLATCIQRDPKGIYRKAAAGEATHVPGLQVVYEPPEEPDVVVHGDRDKAADGAHSILEVLIRRGFLNPSSASPS
jgi:adenylylsulfate kinase